MENNVRRWRRKRGLTRLQLAQAAGVSKNTVTNTELGYHVPHVQTLMRLAKALDTSLDELLTESAA